MAIRHVSELALTVSDEFVPNELNNWWKRLRDKSKPVKTKVPGYTIVPATKGDKSIRALFLLYEGKPVGYLVMDQSMQSQNFLPSVPDLYVPHSFLDPKHRGQGLVIGLYEWALRSGVCFITNSEQTPDAFKLWQKLSKAYPLYWVDFDDEEIFKNPDRETKLKPDTEMLLIGKGYSISNFKFERL